MSRKCQRTSIYSRWRFTSSTLSSKFCTATALCGLLLAASPSRSAVPSHSAVIRFGSCGQAFNQDLVSSDKIVVVVDGYSSGQHLPEPLKNLGYKIIHVKSKETHIPFFENSFKPKDYIAHSTITNPATLTNFVNQVKSAGIKVAAVFAGAEPGVALADQLALKLGVSTTNRPEYARARYNKFALYDRLREAGVPTALFESSDNLHVILDFARHNPRPKYFLKPEEGSGSSSSYMCESEAEIVSAFEKIQTAGLGRGYVRKRVVIQEYLEGTEYAVNFVSSNGRHVLTDIWKYIRDPVPGAGTAYGADILIASNGPIQEQLISYAKQVLDAVGLNFGPSHIEIKMTSRGPIVLDLGARLCGADLPRMAGEATGRNIPALVAQAYLDPKAFEKEVSGYEIKEHRIVVFLRSAHENTRRLNPKAASVIERLPGVRAVKLEYKPGELLKRTVDANTVVGTVELAGPDMRILENTMKAIRVMEERGALEN